MSFVSELHRRQVFRTAAWYGGLAWVAIEVANTVFPNFGLPQWSVRAVIIAATPSPAGTARGAIWRIPSFWIALTPEQIEPLLEAAFTLMRLGRHAEAEPVIRASIERAPARPGSR